MPYVVKSRTRYHSQNSNSPGFCLLLQLDYDLLCAARDNGERIKREVQPHAA